MYIGDATPLFTVSAQDFQPIIDTLTSLLTTTLPVVITIAGLWIGYRMVKKVVKGLGK